jgi:hypothetical protein
MAFSASDWRNRMNFYDGYYSAFTWGALGAAQGNRTYRINTYFASTSQVNGQYIQCSTGYNTPCVEPFYTYSSWTVYYNTYASYQTEFGSPCPLLLIQGIIVAETGTHIGGQSTYETALGTAYLPSAGFYNQFYSGFPYNYYSEYTGYILSFGGISSISPTTFYNYKNGPYLSYYQYSLSNGYNTNYPYQVVGTSC